jgi:hypothetical protein
MLLSSTGMIQMRSDWKFQSAFVVVCQAVTVRRAEEKATSGGLLAKLHYGVVQFLEEAATLLRAHIGDWNDVSDKLRVQILSYNRTCDRIYFIQYMLLEALNLMGSWCASSIFLCIFHCDLALCLRCIVQLGQHR